MSCDTPARRLDALRPAELVIPRAAMVLVFMVYGACTYPYIFHFGPVRVLYAVQRLSKDLGLRCGHANVLNASGVNMPLMSYVAHNETLYVYTF